MNPDMNLDVSETTADSSAELVDQSPRIDTSAPQHTFADYLSAHIRFLVSVSKEYQAKITTAKTGTKKQYYLKKLKKNNKTLADMLVRYEHVSRSTAATTNT